MPKNRKTHDRRAMDGQRLYRCLALFDKRDGSPLADIVQAAREGWERSHPDMAEDCAWDDFERLIDRWNETNALNQHLSSEEADR